MACEEDCSAGVNSIVKAIGFLLNDEKLQKVNSSNTSRNTKAGLQAAGFETLTEKKYLTSGKYLLPGDVLLYENHHVAINVTRGAKAEDTATPAQNLGDCILSNGCEGADVKELQAMLVKLGYSCGSYGCDGDFGDATELAVRKFQREHAPLEVDGEVGTETLAAIRAALETDSGSYHVKIVGGNCYVRPEPAKTDKNYGVAKEGEMYPYLGETSPEGWLKISFKSCNGWVSGKYGRIV